MVIILRIFAVLLLLGGIYFGVIMGTNVLVTGDFVILAALPAWIGGLALAVLFVAVAEILRKLERKKDNGV